MSKQIKSQVIIKIIFLLLFILCSATTCIYAQKNKKTKRIVNTHHTFRDTIFNMAFDSLSHNLGNLQPINDESRVVKYFKYIGTEPISIKGVWTFGPHFICDFPKEPLEHNKVYSYTVCFNHQNRIGSNIRKQVGFYLSEVKRVELQFTGNYFPVNCVTSDSLIYQVLSCYHNKIASEKPDKSLQLYGLYISDSLVEKESGWFAQGSKSVPKKMVIYYTPAFIEVDDLDKRITYRNDTLIINAKKEYTYLIATNQPLNIGKRMEGFENNSLPLQDYLFINHEFGFDYREGVGGIYYPQAEIEAVAELDQESGLWEYVLYYTKGHRMGSEKEKVLTIASDSYMMADYDIKQIQRMGIPLLAWYGYLDNDDFVDMILRYYNGYNEEFQLILSSKLKESYRKRISTR